jgi:hypothetical protein
MNKEKKQFEIGENLTIVLLIVSICIMATLLIIFA